MNFTVRELPKAKADKLHIVRWLNDRSPSGAADAYDQLVEQLNWLKLGDEDWPYLFSRGIKSANLRKS